MKAFLADRKTALQTEFKKLKLTTLNYKVINKT